MTKLFKLDIRSRLICRALITIVCLCNCFVLALADSVHPVCLTEDCRKLADYYKKNMNKHGNPCTDFHDYVCHNWGKQHPKPKYHNLWDVLEYQTDRTKHDIKELLEDIKVSTVPEYEDAKVLYRACMNLPFMEKNNPLALKRIMFPPNVPIQSKKIPWWEIEAKYINMAGESSIFNHYLISDIQKKNRVTLLMRRPYSPYGMLDLHSPLESDSMRHYKSFLTRVVNNVMPYDTKNLKIIDIDLNHVLDFRDRIRQISNDATNRNETVLMGIKDFQEWYDKQHSGRDTAKIKWLTMIRSVYKNFKDAYGMTVQENSTMSVQRSYFASLAKILENTPEDVLKNHVHLYFAERQLKLDAEMEADLEETFSRDADISGNIRYEPEKWAKCIDGHNMETTLKNMYINSRFSMASKTEVQQLLDEEILLLGKQISESSWLDSNTKTKFIGKLNNIKSQIGFPDWYFPTTNPGVKQPCKENCDVDPIKAGAYYAPALNKVSLIDDTTYQCYLSDQSCDVGHRFSDFIRVKINDRKNMCFLDVSATSLQWPVFMPNMPFAISHAAIGFFLGHELYHGFDCTGVQYDECGKKTPWWPQYMYPRFRAQVDCLKSKYDKYRNQEFQKSRITKEPTHSTINEDIADAMGLKLAYRSYKEQVYKNNGTCAILPGFDNLSCEKLFFIAFANTLCADFTPRIEENLLLHDKHSLPHIRVNVAVGNMKEFIDAFECKPNNPMVPETMCDIWKLPSAPVKNNKTGVK